MRFFRRKQRLNLALEGGGAHGAFTWGVLDRLLEDETLDIAWISATSAGAVNAVAVAAGLAEGGRAGRARQAARGVGGGGQGRRSRSAAQQSAGWPASAARRRWRRWRRLFSPYDFNPLGFDPFRKLLEAHIDFALLRTTPGPELLIAATDVATGRPRLFRRREITVQSVLASACLPTLHHAVTIDGRAYWDGGFSANPDLAHAGAREPGRRYADRQAQPACAARACRPARARSRARINQITFDQPMLRDIEVIETVRAHASRWSRASSAGRRAPRPPPLPSDRGGPLHQRAGAREQGQARPRAADLPARRRPQRDREVAGARRADIGRRATVDLGRHFLAERPAPQAKSGQRAPPEAAA